MQVLQQVDTLFVANRSKTLSKIKIVTSISSSGIYDQLDPVLCNSSTALSPADVDTLVISAQAVELLMAMATNFVTLGELWSSHVEMEEEDEAIFSRIKILIENHLPDGWRDWKVIDWKKEDLFGKKIDHKVLNKIRFALPTLELVKAFYPEATSVGEKTYRNIKLTGTSVEH
ncbi:unnamed protein product [Acanthoscelides obtectus]|uniref:Uncharacterized protein n=1 Tax=Acanthoscelides obtectus TaxID=200917 RepID=A0A9P0LWB7_ACAOB|nr:unnamed protein product [Acanthoscelides obtectus]CAK1621968.1 hypothetical protein AOBTE_LOCUS1243 [Acanthoscelides obtectus]